MKPSLAAISLLPLVLLFGCKPSRHHVSTTTQLSDIKFKDPSVADLADLLNIQFYAGSFEFHEPYKEIKITLEGYRNEDLIFSASSGHIISNGEINFTPGMCEFRITIIDMDIIRLENGKPGDCRVFVGYSTKTGVGSSAPTDISKKTFDLSLHFNGRKVDSYMKPETVPLDKDTRTLLFELPSFRDPTLHIKCYFYYK